MWLGRSEREIIGLNSRSLCCDRPLELTGYSLLKWFSVGLTRISVVQASCTKLLGVQILCGLLGWNCKGLLLRYIELRLLKLRSILLETLTK